MAISSVPSQGSTSLANVSNVISPSGMFDRPTSVPFRYTTAPSSRSINSSRAWKAAGSTTSNSVRKYAVGFVVPMLVSTAPPDPKSA